MQRRAIIVVLAVLVGQAEAAEDAAPRHKLECPAVAPAVWGLAGAKLAGVEVLSAPRGEKIDETAPPSLMPDGQSLAAGTLRQEWRMNEDGPGWVFFVDCHYRGSERVLRLDAAGVKRCQRTIAHFSPSAGESAGSEQAMVCD